ncbi:MAG: protein-disulfide reductase DsbD domain-containing protein [Sneathiella sp.]
MRLSIFSLTSTTFACFFVCFGTNAIAETATEWIRTDQSSLRLISEFDGVAGRESLRIGLQIKLGPGWKTYWRTPGDAGIPPRFDWSGSKNFKEASVSWPLPEMFEAYGLTSWGYHDEVVFPIEVSLQEAGKPLELRLRLQLGICEKVCIPYEHQFSLYLDADTAELSPEVLIIDKYVKRVPAAIGTGGSAIRKVRAETLNDREFKVIAHTDKSFNSPEIIVEGKDGAYFELISTIISTDQKAVDFTLKADLPAKTDVLSGQSVTVTIADKGSAAEGQLRIE